MITKATYTISSVQDGQQGLPGTSVTISSVEYTSSSADIQPTSGWQPVLPIVSEGMWLWTKITYSDGTVVYSKNRQGEDGRSIINTEITYTVSSSGTVAPTADLTNENGLILLDYNGDIITTTLTWTTDPPDVPEGYFLWTRTVFTYSDNSTSAIYTVSHHGETGDQGVSVIRVVPEYSLSESREYLSEENWSEEKPEIDADHYIWTRQRNELSDGSIIYSSANCDIVISGIISRVDYQEQQITNKIWESDITSSINQYDNTITQTIRDRVSTQESALSGITSRVSDVETTTDNFEIRMNSAESTISQHANSIEAKVDKNGVITSINLSPETAQIQAEKIDLIGKVNFNMLDNSTQNSIDSIQPELIIGTHGTSATATWTGISTKLSSLSTGTRILFQLSSAGASNVTLNLTLKNGTETGSIPVYYSGTTRLGTQYPVNSIIDLVYTGSHWYVANPYTDNNTIGSYGASSLIAGEGTIRQYSLIMKDSENTWSSFTSTSGIGTAKTKNTIGYVIDKIYYMSAESNYTAGNNCGTCYDSYAVDLRYSLNCGINTLTPGLPLYIVGKIEDDGLFYLEDVWWTQTKPSNEDGKTYIYVGVMYSSYQIYLSVENPAYQFYNGKVMTLEDIEIAKANLWINSSGKIAKEIVDSWATDATKINTTINGGLIETHSILAKHLSSDAIMSNNYIATTGEGPYSNAGVFLDLSNGNFYAPNFGIRGSTGEAYLNGKIITTSGLIGGFQIDSDSIHTNEVPVTSNENNSVSFSSSGFTRTLLSTSRDNLRLAIGDKFGVTGEGVLYTSGANITEIDASNVTTGTLNADRIAVGSLNIGKLDSSLQESINNGEIAKQTAENAKSTADSASSQAAANSEAIRVSGLSLEAFREEIRLAVASLANGTQIFKGDPLEDYQTEEIPTLLNYPTFTEFFIWDKCSTELICSDDLICGTNNYAAHKNEIALCTTYNDFYQFRQASEGYSWEQMTAAEIEELSNRYSFVSVDEDGVTIKSSKNNQTGELKVTSDGVIPSRIFCC